jgi:hypothetical protein
VRNTVNKIKTRKGREKSEDVNGRKKIFRKLRCEVRKS